MEEAFRKAGYKVEKTEQKSSQSLPSQGKFQLQQNYTVQAEQVILDLKTAMGRDYQNFTTSKIRNILARVSEIYNDVLAEYSETLDLEIQSRIEYLKVRLVYECGREPRVIKPFVDKAGLLQLLNGIGASRQNFINFARYMEALVAYHRFHGGRD
ncbi:type III-A CRISPR-associated protein Csm2 [Syntrophomonas palmitatica]|uniref:type III-A CRISPR-associated protein Csm2 n=1 Tax=Syntrophomonas palmitatica TaxID=402877 RepID=UPI0009F84328|nr:type III-A CRISPR-associated protein Csm2 [Syntrophomonas palmitatica]